MEFWFGLLAVILVYTGLTVSMVSEKKLSPPERMIRIVTGAALILSACGLLSYIVVRLWLSLFAGI